MPASSTAPQLRLGFRRFARGPQDLAEPQAIAIVLRVDWDCSPCQIQGSCPVVGLERHLGREPLEPRISQREALVLQLPDQLVGLIVTAAFKEELDRPADDVEAVHAQFDRPQIALDGTVLVANQVIDLGFGERDQGPGRTLAAGIGQVQAGLLELLLHERASPFAGGRPDQQTSLGTPPEGPSCLVGGLEVVLDRSYPFQDTLHGSPITDLEGQLKLRESETQIKRPESD